LDGTLDTIDIFTYVDAQRNCDLLEEVSCTDSDGGEDYDVRGETKLTRSDGETFSYEDFCIDSEKLNEYSCNLATIDKENCLEGCNLDVQYNCPNGCVDGACVEETPSDDLRDVNIASDLNGDLIVDNKDRLLLIQKLDNFPVGSEGCDSDNGFCLGSDVDENGEVEEEDLRGFINVHLSSCLDIKNNDYLNVTANMVKTDMGKVCDVGNNLCDLLDINLDGVLNTIDIFAYIDPKRHCTKYVPLKKGWNLVPFRYFLTSPIELINGKKYMELFSFPTTT